MKFLTKVINRGQQQAGQGKKIAQQVPLPQQPVKAQQKQQKKTHEKLNQPQELTFVMICQQFEALARGGDQKQSIRSLFDSKPAQESENISTFLYRLTSMLRLSEHCLLMTMIYMMRFQTACKGFQVNSKNINLLTLASVIAACKFSADHPPSQEQITTAAQISSQDLSILEWNFMQVLDLRLYISGKELDRARATILSRYTQKQTTTAHRESKKKARRQQQQLKEQHKQAQAQLFAQYQQLTQTMV